MEHRLPAFHELRRLHARSSDSDSNTLELVDRSSGDESSMSSGLLEQYEAYQREHGTGKGKGQGALSFTITEVPRAERGPGLPSGPEAEERGPGLPSGPQNEGDENSGGKGQQVTAEDLHAAGFSSFISAGSTSTSSARESPYAYGKDQSKGKTSTSPRGRLARRRFLVIYLCRLYFILFSLRWQR